MRSQAPREPSATFEVQAEAARDQSEDGKMDDASTQVEMTIHQQLCAVWDLEIKKMQCVSDEDYTAAHWSKYATAVDHALMYLGFA